MMSASEKMYGNGRERPGRELYRIGNEAVGLLAPTKQAEVIHDPEPPGSRVRMQGTHGFAPGEERLARQICGLTGNEEAIEIPENVSHRNSAAA